VSKNIDFPKGWCEVMILRLSTFLAILIVLLPSDLAGQAGTSRSPETVAQYPSTAAMELNTASLMQEFDRAILC